MEKKLLILLATVLMVANVMADATKQLSNLQQRYDSLKAGVANFEYPFQTSCKEWDLGTLCLHEEINRTVEFYMTNVSDQTLKIHNRYNSLYANWLIHKLSFSKQDSILPNERVKVTLYLLDWNPKNRFTGSMFRKALHITFSLQDEPMINCTISQTILFVRAKTEK